MPNDKESIYRDRQIKYSRLMMAGFGFCFVFHHWLDYINVPKDLERLCIEIFVGLLCTLRCCVAHRRMNEAEKDWKDAKKHSTKGSTNEETHNRHHSRRRFLD